MTDGVPLDDAALVLVAAAVTSSSPAAVLAAADVAALARVTAAVETAKEPLDVAATALVALAVERPFGGASDAVAWLTCAVVAPDEAARLAMDAHAVERLVAEARRGGMTAADVRAVLADQRGRLPWDCPLCGRSLHLAAEVERGALLGVGPSRVELVARCAVEHRAHGRFGQPPSGRGDDVDVPWRPVITNEPARAMLVLADHTSVLLVRVDGGYAAGDVSFLASDLVGTWDGLIEEADLDRWVSHDAVVLNPARSMVDWTRLAGALAPADERIAVPVPA